MTVAAGAELGRHVLHHLGVERLVHGDEDAAHQQRGDQVLGANFELLGQVLHADALGHGDLAGDGQRLVAVLHAAIAWRRHKALHRAFLGLGILLLAAAAAARGRALRARRFAGRRCAAGAGTRRQSPGAAPPNPGRAPKPGRAPGAAGPPGRESARRGARGMLGPRSAGELSGSAWPAGIAGRGHCRAARRPAIEDRLAALNSAAGCQSAGGGGCGTMDAL